MRPPGAVIFDFDLTLVESTEGVTDCANYALQALGLPTVSTDRVRQTIGLTLPHTFHALSGKDAWTSHDAVSVIDSVADLPGVVQIAP